MIAPYALSASGLAVGYRRGHRRTPILANLDLAVAPGELVAFLGPNGSGKSTLLRTLARMQRPLAGTVALLGTDIATIRQIDLARLVGLVLTERLEVAALNAAKVVALGRYARLDWSGRMTEADHAAVQRALAATGAAHLANRDFARLSDGEKQRVNIARALAQQPAVLLLDEPTAFLDAPSRAGLMGLLRQLARSEGLAIVVATHDLDLALSMADAAWLVAPGGTFHAGAPEDLIAAGIVERAFATPGIGFRPAERVFRPDAASGPLATAAGPGAGLAATVLERAGFRLTSDGGGLVVTADAAGRWRAAFGDERAGGDSFASLARFAHGLAQPRTPTPASTTGRADGAALLLQP